MQEKLIMGKWNWVRVRGSNSNERLHNVGILEDGTLHNPNGYPEEVVRASVLAAEADRHERRSKAAKAAAATRKRWQDGLTIWFARRVLQGRGVFGPKRNCEICGKALTDQASIDRGIGSDCWGNVMRYADRIRASA
jgi:hypothetical protein